MIFYWHSGLQALFIRPEFSPTGQPLVVRGTELRAMGYAWDDLVAARSLPRADTSPIQVAGAMPKGMKRR
jgi:hypothetical protein